MVSICTSKIYVPGMPGMNKGISELTYELIMISLDII